MHPEEVLFEQAISDARLKGAPIASWNHSVNGRVVIHCHGDLPKYFINLAWALDSLIHRYNLKKHYSSAQEFLNQLPNIYTSSKTIDTLESRLVSKCDALLLQDDSDFTTHDKHKIFDTIHKTYIGHVFTYKEFTLIRDTLADRYMELASESINLNNRKRLQKIVRFFQTISFSDINTI